MDYRIEKRVQKKRFAVMQVFEGRERFINDFSSVEAAKAAIRKIVNDPGIDRKFKDLFILEKIY